MNNLLANHLENGIHEIRPKILFKKIEEAFPDQNTAFTVNIPSSSIGGLTLLESSILITLLKLLSPSEIFEFGTYLGATSVLLAENSPANTLITTVDLAGDSVTPSAIQATHEGNHHLVDDVANDNYLRQMQAKSGALCINRAKPDIRRKITQLYLDSRTLDPASSNIAGRFDYIFIDGGHDFDTISIDTANALKISKKDSVIIWHDYRSKIHGDVTTFVDQFSRDNPVIHVENTMLAFTLRGEFARLL